MTKSFATCCVSLALLIGCGGGERAAQDEFKNNDLGTTANESTTEFECRPDDNLTDYPAFSPRAAAHVEFQCLEFGTLDDLDVDTRDYRVVDIEPGSDGHAGTNGILRIALHEIKTKAFLQGQNVAIVSNGKRFGAIERECAAIRSSGVKSVVALVNPRQDSESPQWISAREFIAERPYGVWRLDNRSSNAELDSPLLIDAAGIDPVLARQQQSASRGLPIRTLVVADSGVEASLESAGSSRHFGYIFILEGGLQGLREYEVQASAMARAKARPRIGERGCRS